MTSGLALALAGVAAVYLVLCVLLRQTQDEEEPPTVENSIPFITPALQMMIHKSKFYVRMRSVRQRSRCQVPPHPREPHRCNRTVRAPIDPNKARRRAKFNLPIYTLRLPGHRLYVVNSTSLIPIVQRQFRTLAFTPIEAKAAADVMGASNTANEILAQNMTGDEGYLMGFAKAIHPALSPGASLDAMNRVTVQAIAESLNRKRAPMTVDMFKWIRHKVVFATTEGVYGPKNPFRDAPIEDAW